MVCKGNRWVVLDWLVEALGKHYYDNQLVAYATGLAGGVERLRDAREDHNQKPSMSSRCLTGHYRALVHSESA